MSRKFFVGIVMTLLIVVAGFAYFILKRTQPVVEGTLSSYSKSLSDPKIVNTFLKDESTSYISLRGLLTAGSTSEIKVLANTGGNNVTTYEISERTRIICLERTYENSWLDFHEILDNQRVLDKYPEKYVQKEMNSLDTSGKQQVLFSKSKNGKYPDILWVIGCMK